MAGYNSCYETIIKPVEDDDDMGYEAASQYCNDQDGTLAQNISEVTQSRSLFLIQLLQNICLGFAIHKFFSKSVPTRCSLSMVDRFHKCFRFRQVFNHFKRGHNH